MADRVFESLPGLFLALRADKDLTIVDASEDVIRSCGSVIDKPLAAVFGDAVSAARRVVTSRARQSVTLGDRRFVCAPVLDEEGTVGRVVLRIDEVNKDLRANEILDSITEGFVTLDREWRFDFVNREALRILGCAPGDLNGRTLWEMYPGLEGTEFERAYQKAMFEGLTSSFTAYYPLHERWYEVTAYPAPSGMSVNFRNVTEARVAAAERERLVAASEAQKRIYETALSNTPDLVYIFGLDHRFMYANEALLHLWGLTHDEAMGRDWKGLGYEDWHAQMHDREIDQVIATGDAVRGEVPFNGTGGRRIYDYIFAPVFGADGSVVAVAGTTRDVTDRQRNEQNVREQAERLVEADRAKDLFLATLAHELRNPLAPVRTGLDLLRSIGAGDATTKRIRETMSRQLDHLVRLVDDLLEMSFVTQGTFSLQRAPTDLAMVVQTAIETSEPLIQSFGHRVEIDLGPEALVLDGDATRLSQILSNLLANAARYTPAGGRITISARREEGFAVVRVTDNGRGIPAGALGHIFEMFNRGDLVSGKAASGLGIGLALARRLAEMHGGTLEAKSDGPGKGSALTLRLRLPAEQPAVVTPAPAAVSTDATAQARVLVVDDNEDAAEMLGLLVESSGAAEVSVAHDGRRALEAVRDKRPTIVFLDIGMPDMDGYAVAREIRAHFDEPRMLLVALTGWGQDEDKRQAREAGFDHHLVKPVALDTIRSILAGGHGIASSNTLRE